MSLDKDALFHPARGKTERRADDAVWPPEFGTSNAPKCRPYNANKQHSRRDRHTRDTEVRVSAAFALEEAIWGLHIEGNKPHAVRR